MTVNMNLRLYLKYIVQGRTVSKSKSKGKVKPIRQSRSHLCAQPRDVATADAHPVVKCATARAGKTLKKFRPTPRNEYASK
jgi:hypothetical protein